MQHIELDDLLQELDLLTRKQFQARYPGMFLVTMGVLSAEVRPNRPSRGDDTSSLAFGPHLRHDVTQRHPLAGKLFALGTAASEDLVTIGRGEDCDIVVPEPSVSEKHCRLRVTDLGVIAVDLASTNGTTVNLERLTAGDEALLVDEDILTLGRYSFQVMQAGTLYDALMVLRDIEDEG